MKRTILFFSILLVAATMQAQDIFKKHGYDRETLTLSKGRYKETFVNENVMQIGTVLIDTRTDKVVQFLEEEATEVVYRAENTSRFLTPDPLAEKYPWLSPYAYCANNPVRYIDPTGMIWEESSLAEVNRLKETLNNRIRELNSKMANYQDMLNNGNLSEADIETYTKEISAFGDMVSNLGTSINDIDRLGNDQNHTYALNSNESTQNGYVSIERDGKISIVGNGSDLTVHEVTHVRQSLDAGSLNFDRTTKKLQYTSPRVEVQAAAEVEAYQKQFSVKRTDYHPGFGLIGPNDITPQVVGSIRRSNGTLIYPAIYNRYVRNLRQR